MEWKSVCEFLGCRWNMDQNPVSIRYPRHRTPRALGGIEGSRKPTLSGVWCDRYSLRVRHELTGVEQPVRIKSLLDRSHYRQRGWVAKAP